MPVRPRSSVSSEPLQNFAVNASLWAPEWKTEYQSNKYILTVIIMYQNSYEYAVIHKGIKFMNMVVSQFRTMMEFDSI